MPSCNHCTTPPFFQGFLFTPIFRYSSERPLNLLTGAELNNDRHNTTNRPYFAGRNIGIAPSFWPSIRGSRGALPWESGPRWNW
jgi:hypothetical protein